MGKIQNVVIAAAKRTPVGSFQGSISSVSGPDLGAKVIGGILEETMLDPASVNEVIMGNVLAAGLGQAPARQAALESGLPCLLYTSPSPRDRSLSRMPSSA